MNDSTMMALGTLALVSVGCAPTIRGEAGGSAPVGTGASGVHAVAMRVADLPGGTVPWMSHPAENPGSANPDGSFTPKGGPVPVGMDPDALVLFLSSEGEACSEPGVTLPCNATGSWQYMLFIPPELDDVGPIDLEDPRITLAQAGVPPLAGGQTACGFGFGMGSGIASHGTLEIVSSDPTSLSLKISGGVTAIPNDVIDGAYTATRCGAPPAPRAPSPAIAIQGSKLPPGSSSSSTVGSDPDPNALYLFLGTADQSCQDPLSAASCNGTSRMVLRLPASLQHAGTIDLSDASLAASYAVYDGPPSCSATGGSFANGTLTIESIDASSVVFRVYGSFSQGQGGTFDLDGRYAATICP